MSDSDSTTNEQIDGAQSEEAAERAESLEGPQTTAADDIGQSTSGEAATAEPQPAPDPEPPPKTTLTVTIDERPFEAQPGQLVIDACEDAGVYVPRFCYHPRMTPVGMCRQCLVEVEGPRGPMMVVSCMTPVAEGQVVRTATDGIKRAQEGVLELLLANHPLDCPVCDKGGECPLQDQAFSHGPGESRYIEEKRHYEKPIPISDLVLLDRERCILCDRCTRFADEVAGDPLISFVGRGNTTQVLTFPEQPFASYFSGNTVQICPVGALTATPYRFKARPWDLDQVESTCTTCSVGCRIVVQSSRDRLVRYLGVDSDPVNWGWLCDRGRFNFEAVHGEGRLGAPLVKGEGGLAETSWGVAMRAAAQLVEEALAAGGPTGIAILGGARGTNEDAYAWASLADAIGTPHRDAQLADGLPAELLALPRATIDEAAAATTLVLLAPDLKEELPVLYLRLRHAAEQRRTRIVELSPAATGLTPYAWRSIRYEAGASGGLQNSLADRELAEQLARGPVVVVAGRANLAESAAAAATALRTVLDACPGAKVLPTLRRGNVVGALQLGLSPQPGGLDGAGILTAAAEGRLDLLILLGADPLADCPDADLARRALAGARRIIAIDTFLTDSSATADVVLAAAAGGEKAGTTTNLEGRVTEVGQKVTVHGTARPDWMIASELAELLGHEELAMMLSSVDAATDAIAAAVPAYAGASRAALRAAPDGVLAVPPPDAAALQGAVTRAPDRISYDYRLVLSRRLYDQAVGTARSPSLAPLAVPAAAHANPLDLDRLGVSAGTEVRLVGTRGVAVLPLAADDGVARGSLWVPFNVPGATVTEIVDLAAPATDVRIERMVMLATDPLLLGDLTWTPLLIVVVKVLVIFAVGLLGTMFMVWFERKMIAGMQNRVGPNKAGPFGILQTLADGMKLIFKEDFLPDRADRIVYRLAPFLAFVPAFLVWSVIPLGGDFSEGRDGIVEWFGEQTRVQLADPPVGILLVLALSSLAVYGIMLAGWSSGSKYPLLGAVRASAQMVSYEAALGLSLAAVLLSAGTLSTVGIVVEQDTLSNWNLVATGLVPFAVFLIAATAELNRPPFDLVEAEQELVGGFNTEYSAFGFALFFLAEFMNTITMSGVIVTLFLGGPQPIAVGDWTADIPLIPNGLEGTVWFVLKLFLFLYAYVWFRATLPRLRYDQLMDLGWKVMIPVALGWFLLLAAIQLGRDRDWNVVAVVVITIGALVVSGALLLLAVQVSGRRRQQEGAMT